MKKVLSFFLGLLFSIAMVAAQSRTITGKVTEKNGQPIDGASVQIKGSKTGVAADPQGNFKITAKTGDVLIITAVNFGSKEVKVGSESTVTITLEVQLSIMEEVVVTAFGIKREKKALGYAVSTVNKEQLELRPEGDLGRVLNGKVPGLNILGSSGLSGSGTNIVVRAISTVTGSSQPLFIVDGVPFNGSTNTQSDFRQGNQTSSRFLDLDPNNIASVSVLKGLSATVLYGEDGRNGVILITTKNASSSPVKKKTEVTVAQSFFTSKAFLPDYQNNYG
ncbi:MAG TPA: TonB-dependent receptor plug domain-containing protein, partial [Chitinophagaceae bacterium]|nr:TonB-dependent receptor plug domain-containing protein [Chitinophagaceae bacterium]